MSSLCLGKFRNLSSLLEIWYVRRRRRKRKGRRKKEGGEEDAEEEEEEDEEEENKEEKKSTEFRSRFKTECPVCAVVAPVSEHYEWPSFSDLTTFWPNTSRKGVQLVILCYCKFSVFIFFTFEASLGVAKSPRL